MNPYMKKLTCFEMEKHYEILSLYGKIQFNMYKQDKLEVNKGIRLG